MIERSYTHVDKSSWGAGTWQEEPDKVQWIDAATDLDCLAVRNRFGVWCGYVGVPPDHPIYGTAHQDLDYDVHGALTFSDRCHEDGPPESSICHVPAPGRPDNVWWLGFDCGHAWDFAPGLYARERALGISMPVRSELLGESYKTLDYVRAECARLALQLKEDHDSPDSSGATRTGETSTPTHGK